jgi:hypothetical protein
MLESISTTDFASRTILGDPIDSIFYKSAVYCSCFHKITDSMAYAKPPFRNLVVVTVIHVIIGFTSFVGAKDDNSFLRDSFQKRVRRCVSNMDL